jgi:uncharacterized protein DUF2637
MNSPLPASGPAQHRNWTRRLVNVLVTLAVIAVAAATFVFSYDGVHAIALLGGVSTQLARYYPGLFDAVLVIACVAAVMLRDGPWWARLWAWVVLIVVLAAIGTTDVLHAMNYTLRHRATEGIVAAAPVVAVLLAFSLLLTLLRQSRTHAHEPAGPAPHDVPALTAAIAVPPIALPAVPATTSPSASAKAPTESFPVLEETLPGDVPPTRADPVVAQAAEEPAAWEVPAWEAPTREVPTVEGPAAAGPAAAGPAAEETPVRDEPAPPTVQIPALPAEPPPGEAAPARSPQGIRYAGNGVPGMAGAQQADKRDAARDDDDWEAEAGQFAGLVYPAREDHQDARDSDDVNDDSGDVTDDSDDAAGGEPSPRKDPPELDDDAPPFATAPFAPVPRLNRVRSTPTPPADEDE